MRMLERITILPCALLLLGCGGGAANDIGRGGAGGAASGRGGAGGRSAGGAGGTGIAGNSAGVGGMGVADGEAGQGGDAPGGGGGSVPETTCTFDAEGVPSPMIPTVGIVTWSTTLTSVTSAEIRFGLMATGPTMTAPVDLTQPGNRTLLLGMKGNSAYVYRIVATSSEGRCTSPDYTIATGPVPTDVPRPTVTIMNAAAHARGFIISSSGTNGNFVYVLDADGEPVWWANGPDASSRGNMSWDGGHMYVMALNVQNNGGEVRRIAMDGMTVETKLSGLDAAHHDLTAIPGGLATLLWNTPGLDVHCSLVERSDDGELTTIVADTGNVYNSTMFHANALHYYPGDDSYTISDRDPSLFVKVTRKGQLVWQFGGMNPKDPAKYFTSATVWQVNHGHHLLPNGNFLFFNNGQILNGMSTVQEYKLDTATMTATNVWTYQADTLNSRILGDVQRLPNGNTLVTFSSQGTIQELDSKGKLVMTLKSANCGYAEWRPSLYGPPLR
jgi:hypothetical protein